ncbi:ABC transporter substrate-binding protein [Cohnella abietis]|uniref:Sugar ABC transporter substrate-binding protein n=1 Tax=Cohnella abietis TaxID=2507935 RepID=A0A3T1D457_9BACL|nr:extracellular solute-binding protein [Cohnella abietis]BBI32841.1 sugar ABC transporter substrate-binding protein [Cohnella abietis]
MKTKNAGTKFMALILTFSIILAGCGGNKNNSASESPSASPSGSPTASSGGEKSPADYKGEVTFWAWGDYESKLIPEFNKEYPNIKVNVVVVPNADYGKKLQTTIASKGNMPDVVLFESSVRGQFLTLDAWENLEKAPYNVNRADIVDFAIPLNENEKGEIVTLQEDATMAGIAYKRDLAKEYFGTDDPDEIEKMFTSWDDFIAKGKEVYAKSGGKVTLMDGILEGGFKLVSGEYTEPFVKDGKLNLESTFLPTYKTLEKMVANNTVGKYETWSAPWNASFSSNTVIFYACPTWFVPFGIKPNDKNGTGNYGLIRAPIGGYSWGGTSMSIPKEAKNKELAWQFVKWVTLSESGATAFKNLNNTATLYKPVFEREGFYTDKDPYFGGQDIMAKFTQLGKEAKVRPITKYDDAILSSNTVVMKMMMQGASAEKAYDALVKDVLKKAPELK